MYITVTTDAPDGLSRETFDFTTIERGNVIQLVFSSYRAWARSTKRHGYRVTATYERLHPRLTTLPLDRVPLTDEVKAEAKRILVEQINVATEP